MKKLMYACLAILFTLTISACNDSTMEEFNELKTDDDGTIGGPDREPPKPYVFLMNVRKSEKTV